MALYIGGVAVDATAAEIDVLDGLDRGSIIYGNASSATTVLGQGGADEVLTSDGTDIAWAAAAGGGGGISHDGSTADGVLTYKDADEATVESNLTFDGTILKLAYGCSFLVGGNVADNTTPETGLCWEAGGNRTSYGIYRTDGAWSSPDYQQLMLKWTTGIIIDGGDAYGKSGLDIQCAVSKSSGSFKIDHPLPSMKDTHHLVHSFTESPRADLIYRDKVTLVDGLATVNIDTIAGMTEGTFVLLCDNVQCFTSNESDWKAVKGSVSGNILTIECEDSSSTADVSWMVVGDRQDEHIMNAKWTDENGKPIIEPEKVDDEDEEVPD